MCVCVAAAVAAVVCAARVCAGNQNTPPPLDPTLLPMNLDHAELTCYGPWAKVCVCVYV